MIILNLSETLGKPLVMAKLNMVDWIPAFLRVRFWALYFSCCTLPSCLKLSTERGWYHTRMLMMHPSELAFESSVAAWRFSECIKEIDGWMQANKLKTTIDKTRLIWIGSYHRSASIRSNYSWTWYSSPHLCQTWAWFSTICALYDISCRGTLSILFLSTVPDMFDSWDIEIFIYPK